VVVFYATILKNNGWSMKYAGGARALTHLGSMKPMGARIWFRISDCVLMRSIYTQRLVQLLSSDLRSGTRSLRCAV